MSGGEPCGMCGNDIWGPMCPVHPFYDPIEDQYWVGPICPHCGITLMGIVHNEQEIREDAKQDSQTRYLPDTRGDVYGG